MKLLFVLGSRGEWGYIRPVIREAIRRGHQAPIVATNMAILREYGNLVASVEEEGFEVSDKILNSLEGGTRSAMAKSLGIFQSSMVDVLERHEPDWVVLAGDRAEQLAAAVSTAYTYIPSAHIQAGERSGNIDGIARHAIGRLVNIHFASNPDAANRLERSGEESWRIHDVGAPQLDEIVSGQVNSVAGLIEKGVRPEGPFLLACFHPVTESIQEIRLQIESLIESFRNQPEPIVWILPNNDAGGTVVRESVMSGLRGRDIAHSNLAREDYLGLLRDCLAIVGNSSSGLLEAPLFGTPALNVGRRQQDRVRGKNVIDAEPSSESIVEGLQRVLDPSFRLGLADMKSPYGSGNSSPKILDVLESCPRDDRLLIKHMIY